MNENPVTPSVTPDPVMPPVTPDPAASSAASDPVAPQVPQAPTGNAVSEPVQSNVSAATTKINKPTFLIAMVAGIFVLVLATIAALMFLNNKDVDNKSNMPVNITPYVTPTSGSNNSSSTGTEAEEDVMDEDERKRIINKIDADTKRIVTAVYQYQSNNRGAVPSINGNKNTSWEYFEEYYLNVKANGEEDTYFKDNYKIVYCEIGKDSCGTVAALNWKKNKYTLYVTSGAVCTDTGVAKSDTSKHVTIYAATPGEGSTTSFVCNNS